MIRPIPLIALAAGAALILASSVQPAGAADADARAFLARIYAHYPVAGKAHPFDPVGPRASQVFDAPLVSLIRRDQNNARDEVGALDGDPLCACQDDDGMRWTITQVVPQGVNKALAQVRLTFPDTPKPRIDDLRLELVKTSAGWRIHDIASSDTPSLRGLFLPADVTYANARFGYAITYPAGLFTPEPEAANGDGRQFHARQGEAKMLVWGAHNALNRSPEDIVRDYARDCGKGAARRKIATARLVAISCVTSAGRVIDQTTLIHKGVLATVRFEYANRERAVWDPVARQVSRTLKMDSGGT